MTVAPAKNECAPQGRECACTREKNLPLTSFGEFSISFVFSPPPLFIVAPSFSCRIMFSSLRICFSFAARPLFRINREETGNDLHTPPNRDNFCFLEKHFIIFPSVCSNPFLSPLKEQAIKLSRALLTQATNFLYKFVLKKKKNN